MKQLVICFYILGAISSAISLEIVNDVETAELTDEVWTWSCNQNLCSKTGLKPHERPIGRETCQLACGKDAGLWPRPSSRLQISDKLVRIDPQNIYVVTKPEGDNDAADIFHEALDLFKQRVSYKDKLASAHGYAMELNFKIKEPNVYKYVQGCNESYQINVSTSLGDDKKVTVTISSENFLGARHGMETLTQLLVLDKPSGQILTPTSTELSDNPAFPYRGICLDTARNFISVKSILRTLDAMAANKLNTFHWHVTDSHSFPFQSRSLPKLTKYGAYSKDKVYTEDDIKQIVRYAQIRGIRIVPELDAPAHVGEGWQWADGAVVCFAAEPWQTYCVEPPCGQLDPTAEVTYQVLQGIYSDMARLFDTDLFHFGGDEVNLNCWRSTDHIVSEMGKMGINTTDEGFHELWGKFQSRVRAIAGKEFGPKVRPVLWTSSLTEGNRLNSFLNKSEYIIQIWTKGNDKGIADIVNSGFPIILSNYDALYLDCGFGAWVGTGNNWCSPYINWQTVYENDPIKLLANLNVSSSLQNLVLGSEATLWTEQADDASIDNRLWPRASAMGESLWSGAGSWKDAENRLLIHRERLIERGIQADTIKPQWCANHEGACYL